MMSDARADDSDPIYTRTRVPRAELDSDEAEREETPIATRTRAH